MQKFPNTNKYPNKIFYKGNPNNSNIENISFVENEKVRDLPIYKYENEIIKRLQNENILIIVGETGSGKTTQIPKIIHKHNLQKDRVICITQPRRVAAISVALRVSKEVMIFYLF